MTANSGTNSTCSFVASDETYHMLINLNALIDLLQDYFLAHDGDTLTAEAVCGCIVLMDDFRRREKEVVLRKQKLACCIVSLPRDATMQQGTQKPQQEAQQTCNGIP